MTFVSNIQSKMHSHVKLDEVIGFPQGLQCRGRRPGQWRCLPVLILNKKLKKKNLTWQMLSQSCKNTSIDTDDGEMAALFISI